jgi:hypothetical protein
MEVPSNNRILSLGIDRRRCSTFPDLLMNVIRFGLHWRRPPVCLQCNLIIHAACIEPQKGAKNIGNRNLDLVAIMFAHAIPGGKSHPYMWGKMCVRGRATIVSK